MSDAAVPEGSAPAPRPRLVTDIDTRPRYHPPSDTLVEAAYRAIPDVLNLMDNEPGEPIADRTDRAVIASNLVRQLEQAGHRNDAAEWAIHHRISDGSLAADGVFTSMPGVFGRRGEWKVQPTEGRVVPKPGDYSAFVVFSTPQLWAAVQSPSRAPDTAAPTPGKPTVLCSAPAAPRTENLRWTVNLGPCPLPPRVSVAVGKHWPRLQELLDAAPRLSIQVSAIGSPTQEQLMALVDTFVRFALVGRATGLAEVLDAYFQCVGSDSVLAFDRRFDHLFGEIMRAAVSGDPALVERWLRVCHPWGFSLGGPNGLRLRFEDTCPSLSDFRKRLGDATTWDRLHSAIHDWLEWLTSLWHSAVRRHGARHDGLPVVTLIETFRQIQDADRVRARWDQVAIDCQTADLPPGPEAALTQVARLVELLAAARHEYSKMPAEDLGHEATEPVFQSLLRGLVVRAHRMAESLGLWETATFTQRYHERAGSRESLRPEEASVVLIRFRDGILALRPDLAAGGAPGNPPPPVGARRNRPPKPIAVPDGWEPPKKPKGGWSQDNVEPFVQSAIAFLASAGEKVTVPVLAAMTGVSAGLVHGSQPWSTYADAQGIRRNRRGGDRSNARTGGMIRDADSKAGLSALDAACETDPGAEAEDEEVWNAILNLCDRDEDRRVLEDHRTTMLKPLVEGYERETVEVFQAKLLELIRSLQDNRHGANKSPLEP